MMACQTYLWTPDRKPEVIAVLKASKTRIEAASKLKVSMASLDHALRVFGLKGQKILQGRPSTPADYAPPVPVETFEAPWQGYRPRVPVSAPVSARVSKGKPVKSAVTVVVSDCHVPNHDHLAWSCALGLIRQIKPDRVVINGDFMELESLSMHPKSKPDLARLASEFYAANLALDELQAASGAAEVVYLEGNHEGRARRWELAFGQLDGILSVPVGLYLQPREEYRKSTENLRGIRWVPLRQQPFAIGAVSYLHGFYESIHHAHKTAVEYGPRCAVNVSISGHMHAFQAEGSNAGHTHYSAPWLGNPEAHTIMAYTKGRPRPWSHGVLVVEEVDEAATVTHVSIKNGRAIYGGKVVTVT